MEITLSQAIDWADGHPGSTLARVQGVSAAEIDTMVTATLNAACKRIPGTYTLAAAAEELNISRAAMETLLRLISEQQWVTEWRVTRPETFTLYQHLKDVR